MFPWGQYENFNDFLKQVMNMKPDDVEDFVNNIMSNTPYAPNFFNDQKERSKNPKNNRKATETANNSTEIKKNQNIKTKIFESHEDVFVQFQIKNKQDLKAGKIFYNSNQLVLKNIPDIGDEQKVLLPAIVKQRGAKTLYKNGVLQIRIPKADDIQFTEIDLNF